MMRVACPRCGGLWYQDLEPGSNLPYTCYRCANTGEVDAPHGACESCGEPLLEGEGAAHDGQCESCATLDEACNMARSELAGLLEG